MKGSEGQFVRVKKQGGVPIIYMCLFLNARKQIKEVIINKRVARIKNEMTRDEINEGKKHLVMTEKSNAIEKRVIIRIIFVRAILIGRHNHQLCIIIGTL